jgi:hypothetical protein
MGEETELKKGRHDRPEERSGGKVQALKGIEKRMVNKKEEAGKAAEADKSTKSGRTKNSKTGCAETSP